MHFFNFLLFYPVFMSIYWIVGSIYYFFTKEITHKMNRKLDIDPEKLEGISFLLACYNESETIEDTLSNVLSLKYEKKEIIIINDGSSDNTAELIYKMKEDPNNDFIFVDLQENRGKANALNQGIKHASYDYVMCLDADTIVAEDAPYYMIENFKHDPKLGAVTGNPRIRNKSSILGKIQTIEYASLIGCIKRSQTLAGAVNTISGVFTLFKKSAVENVGYWDTDMITEDIAASWKLHLSGYHIKYEPRAMCWMLVPETLGGLWKQRVRWAQGGHEVLLRDFFTTMKKRKFPLYILMFEQIISILWVYIVLLYLGYLIITANFLDYTFMTYSFSIFLFSSFTMTFINVVQFTVALFIDSRYEKKNMAGLIFVSWYPTVYWIINAAVVLVAFPKALKRKKGGYATWSSPDRGNIQR
ncbi:poly-beta-1,6 N-acetyl-D-glucosamine synthase [Staphylococcus simiae]|uniref:poly-beta-1,6 N-acetyl-D-glucosamine synthase IcaA n=1 Tax=Staphylococcus simiae TaxID=308354 RepID=UPI001A9784D3|nr:poly-beta-1,6 N-acetyl-D-glucosamine synthase IcaA [Staphylococcus simiae]MBO1199030.1 poly-beta-1,6 N-acetyl-D-glucosamine synthase [Staphylococcus simiae]MBO1201298.1 poly-beta-1,6 N-acetyl-D-glucosamine synthase [Staphylococcus simiae]MBO1203458.1 poly-beta-1,6 N-acetyl-D-glucosamine synthase [Staphylococcus simiae]MBO1210986.1 poly-beta-1,6 N-acetyl-D-glucosamine synthase [Staphylococcus simiae]MBO1229636.1 poly-beta-1,6 N-acetyl-D-glucosamine synthase [Staphylococcus simiae]